jgi:D-alanine-D-alanine ligase-like ATP-grasp enzyme
MQAKTIKRIGILRGGTGKHYYSSLQKGGEIIFHISENLADKYKVFDILVDKDYIWHLNGVPILPADLAQKVDVVWNTSHPSFSNILESLSIPNISAGAFSSALENSREFLREHIKQIGLSMPRYLVSPKNSREVFEKFGAPWIVKILNEIKIVKTFDELTEIINGKKNVIVEEFIPGKIASVHSVPKFRDQDIYIFPLGNSFGIFSVEEKEKLANMAKILHKHLGAKHYLKSDFVLTPRGKIHLLQIDGMPDLKPNSHFSQVAESVGAKMSDVVEHILEQTFLRYLL